METKDFWMVLIICLIVSGIVAFGTVKLTGDVIKVSAAKKGTEVYTKSEVDGSLSKLDSQIRYGEGSVTYDVLVRLNKCEVIKDKQTKGVISCDIICKNNGNMLCVDADYEGTLTSCSQSFGSINTDRFCKCCGL